MVENEANRIGINIRVTDNGIGISKEDSKNLFKMNFQSKNEASRRKNRGGHGIGLNVCQKFAEILGGDLVCNRKRKKGCQFILSLTLEKDDPSRN